MTGTLHIYTRVSTSVQEDDGTSLDTQRELGIERSKNLDMTYQIWNEGSQSSSKDDLSNRPVLTELLEKIQEGVVKHLYVWNTDRLSRNLQTWGLIRLLLIKNDVHLHTPTGEQILSDPTTNLMLGIMSEFSQYDNLIRTERFRLGKIKKIKDGFWKGGPPPYGYKLSDGLLEVNLEESQWVIKIHEWYRDGLSVDEIRTELMTNGVITRRGNPTWSHGSINSLLKNTHYDGYWTFTDKKSDQTVRVSCPRICDPDLVQDVKDQINRRSYKGESRRTKTGVTKHTYLLTGLLVCGHCGSTYYGNLKEGRVSYYHCGQKYHGRRSDKPECGSKRNIRIDTTDKVVWTQVVDVIGSSNLFKENIKQEVVGEESHTRSVQETKKIKRQIDKLNQEIEKITTSIVNLTTDNLLDESRDLKRVIKRLDDRRDEVEEQIFDLTKTLQFTQQEDRWVDWVQSFKSRLSDLDSLSLEEKKSFLEGILTKVVVHSEDKQKHRLEMYFQFPYVGDQLVWNDEENKSKGYQLKQGKKVKRKSVNLLKKLTM